MSAVHPAPAVVLVGRPNVGKSTLFNRLVGARRAIVAPLPGTTRDVIEQPVQWRGVALRLVDTGGLYGASLDPLRALVVARGRGAIQGAGLIIFVVDGREGLVPGDEEIAGVLRVAGKPVIVAVNKIDDLGARERLTEFYRLGFDPVAEISAEHGTGVAELLDEVLIRLTPVRRPPQAVAAETAPADAGSEAETLCEIAVAIVGRPNVGKSSLVNRLLREERVMVSETPGTTRDAVDAVLRWHRRQFRIVDTAGIRRPGRVARAGGVEAVSVVIARRAIRRADVAVLVIDATEGATDQDAAIAGEADDAGCGIVIAVNKWDLVKDRGPEFLAEFDRRLREQLKFIDFAPVLQISALTGERTARLLESIDRVAESRARRVSASDLDRLIAAVTLGHPPPGRGRREVKILHAAQVGVSPPTFVLLTNVATKLHFSYERFLINRLRETFGFVGTPIRLRTRRRPH